MAFESIRKSLRANPRRPRRLVVKCELCRPSQSNSEPGVQRRGAAKERNTWHNSFLRSWDTGYRYCERCNLAIGEYAGSPGRQPGTNSHGHCQKAQDSGENEALQFSSRAYEYGRLPTADSIRLFKMDHGTTEDVIRGDLVTASLSECRFRYTALSYSWCDSRGQETLETTAGTVNIKQNLANALRVLRDSSDVEWLWIDAICINQADHTEKKSQIAKMGDIYQNACSVVIWLDSGAEGSQSQRQTCIWSSAEFLKTIFRGNQLFEADPPLEVAKLRQRDLEHRDFRECVSRLSTTISNCREDDFTILVIALSAAQTSFRPLTIAELARIALVSTGAALGKAACDKPLAFFLMNGIVNETQLRDLHSLLKEKWNAIFFIDKDDCVRFTTDAMSDFLSKTSLPGIDLSHKVMAKACLIELEYLAHLIPPTAVGAGNFQDCSIYSTCCAPYSDILGQQVWKVKLDDSANGAKCQHWLGLSAFSSYSLQFWQFHYARVQAEGSGLSAPVHNLLWRHLSSSCRSNAQAPCSIECQSCLRAAISFCQERNLSALLTAYMNTRDTLPMQFTATTAETNSTVLSLSDTDDDSRQMHYRYALSAFGFSDCDSDNDPIGSDWSLI